ncbi:hypothetical protein [Synechococcus sp. PCC 7502]|nr:hypothetical protein [Synechococcus sp. PCC 7502]
MRVNVQIPPVADCTVMSFLCPVLGVTFSKQYLIHTRNVYSSDRKIC